MNVVNEDLEEFNDPPYFKVSFRFEACFGSFPFDSSSEWFKNGCFLGHFWSLLDHFFQVRCLRSIPLRQLFRKDFKNGCFWTFLDKNSNFRYLLIPNSASSYQSNKEKTWNHVVFCYFSIFVWGQIPLTAAGKELQNCSFVDQKLVRFGTLGSPNQWFNRFGHQNMSIFACFRC